MHQPLDWEIPLKYIGHLCMATPNTTLDDFRWPIDNGHEKRIHHEYLNNLENNKHDRLGLSPIVDAQIQYLFMMDSGLISPCPRK